MTRHVLDKPGELYKPHQHGKVTIYSISGSAKVKLDKNHWQEINPGQEIVIKRGQLHEAVAGPDGWEYIFAWDPEEGRKYGI